MRGLLICQLDRQYLRPWKLKHVAPLICWQKQSGIGQILLVVCDIVDVDATFVKAVAKLGQLPACYVARSVGNGRKMRGER